MLIIKIFIIIIIYYMCTHVIANANNKDCKMLIIQIFIIIIIYYMCTHVIANANNIDLYYYYHLLYVYTCYCKC